MYRPLRLPLNITPHLRIVYHVSNTCTLLCKSFTFAFDIQGVSDKEGFFIECGALDGENLSNTLYLERSLNWTGILIEADQDSFSNLMTKNRKAWAAPICLSTKPYPTEVFQILLLRSVILSFLLYNINFIVNLCCLNR